MRGGVALLGVITAALASWFVDRFGQAQRTDNDLLKAVQQLLVEVAGLREELRGKASVRGVTAVRTMEPSANPAPPVVSRHREGN